MNIPVSHRSPRVYASVLLVTLIIIAGSALAGPALTQVEVAVLLGSIVLLGIPHGTAGHLLVLRDRQQRGTWVDRASCYGRYLAVMVAYGLLLLWAPALALVLFLGLAVLYFGQADLRYLELPAARQVLVGLSRGLLLIGLPLLAHPEAVAPVIERIAGVDVLAWTFVAEQAPFWCAVI